MHTYSKSNFERPILLRFQVLWVVPGIPLHHAALPKFTRISPRAVVLRRWLIARGHLVGTGQILELFWVHLWDETGSLFPCLESRSGVHACPR